MLRASRGAVARVSRCQGWKHCRFVPRGVPNYRMLLVYVSLNSGGTCLSSRGKDGFLMACIASIMSCESSGPRIALMIPGSSLEEGCAGGSVVSVDCAFEAAHSNNCFVRLSMLFRKLIAS